MKYNIKKLLKKVILVSVITVFIMIIILSFNNIKEIWDVVKTANWKYTLYALIALIAYAIIFPLTLCILAKAKKTKIGFFNMFLISATEFFFNGITPFSTGGQPFQVYALNENGVKPSESTGLLLMNFVITQLVVNVFSALAFILFFSQLNESISNMKVLIIIGFSVNLIILLLFIGLATMKSFRTGITKLLILLCKIKFIGKYLSKRIPNFEQYAIDAQLAFKELWQSKPYFVLGFIVKFISQIFFYSIPFFVLKALGIEIGYEKLPFIIGMTSFALTMVTWFPTPGASGGIELAFKSLFVSIAGVTANIAFGGMLLWRLMTYYLLMLLGFIAYMIAERIKKKDTQPENTFEQKEVVK